MQRFGAGSVTSSASGTGGAKSGDYVSDPDSLPDTSGITLVPRTGAAKTTATTMRGREAVRAPVVRRATSPSPFPEADMSLVSGSGARIAPGGNSQQSTHAMRLARRARLRTASSESGGSAASTPPHSSQPPAPREPMNN